MEPETKSLESEDTQRFCNFISPEWNMKRHPEIGAKDSVRCSQLNLTFNQVECSEKQTEWGGQWAH